MVRTEAGDFVYDPTRQEPLVASQPPSPPPVSPPREESPGSSVIERVSRQTGAPRKTSAEYACAFEAIDAVLWSAPYQLIETSKAVRDACAERGHAVGRADVNFILKGIWYRRPSLLTGEASSRDPRRLARAFRENVIQLALGVGLDLSAAEPTEVAAWIEGEAIEDRVNDTFDIEDETTDRALAE